mmetsp:Transcript_43413/g.52641  ORF Transcript_43413/g.52641 Transcript_43413/m.52641 type:complete len:373 (-) Transcript_43413:271-1389(-)
MMVNAKEQIPHPMVVVSGNSSNAGGRVSLSDVISIAKKRWFKVSEMEYLLDPEMTPLPISTHTLFQPPRSGTVLLFDRSATRNYKTDGHRWLKKRNTMKVREDHVKLRSKGKNRVSGFYAHSEDIRTLHRRSYHLLDIDTGCTECPPNQADKSMSLVLVHYLDTANVSKCVVGPGSCVRKKRKRTEGQEPGVSRVKDEAGEVYIGSANSVVNTLFEEYRLLNRWQNQLLSTRHLKLFSKSGFEGSLSPLRSVERLLKQSKQACPEDCISNDVLIRQQNFETQVQDVFDDDDILETLQDLCEDGVEESGAKVDCSTVNFVSNGKCVQDKNSSIVQPNRTFEADFDILWTHLCDEFGCAVSIFLRATPRDCLGC